MPTYRVTTWDGERQKFTPQRGVPSRARGRRALRVILRKLRQFGYQCNRNDSFVLVEREGWTEIVEDEK
jgi:retron-type reverse transcriptase